MVDVPAYYSPRIFQQYNSQLRLYAVEVEDDIIYVTI